MKRLAVAMSLALIAVAAAGAVQFLDRSHQYRRLLASGEQALRARDYYLAIEAFTGALAWRPDSMVAYYRRGEAYRGLRRDDEAARDLREASRLSPSAPQPLVALGELYDLKGEPAQAANWYGQAATRLKDEDPQVLYALALARYRAGSPATAIEPLERAVANRAGRPEAYYLLGLLHRDTQRLEAAISALEQAVRLDPSLVAAREELADAYRAQNRPVEEMRELQALAALDQQVGRRVAIALAELRGGQLDGALGTLTQAAARSPNDSQVQLAIGRVHLARAERSRDPAAVRRALDALEAALGGTARRSEGLALYGRALFLAGELVEAERILREAIATTPLTSEAFAYLADAAEALSHELDARDALINLDVLRGSTAPADERIARARRIGLLSLQGEDGRTAVRYLDRAVNAEPRDVPTLGLLARAQWLAGDPDAARRTLARGLEVDPENGDLRLLGRTIR